MSQTPESQAPEQVHRGPTETWLEGQLVVDLRHAELVRARLLAVAPGLAWRLLATSEALGLVLAELSGVPAAAAELRRDLELVKAAQAARSITFGPDGDVPDLDLVLFKLRKSFSDEFEGWTPTWGKNRLLEGVAGSPYTGGGDERPQPCAAADLPPATGEGVRVGVLDTRLYPHELLAGRYDAGPGDIFQGTEPYPSLAGHSAFVCGAVLREAPNARLVVRAVLDDHGYSVSSWQVAEAMMGFLGKADILNMSFGCTTADHYPPLVLSRAVERLSGHVLLIAAAGNHGHRPPVPAGRPKFSEVTARTPVWPAAYDDVVAVGAAVDDTGRRTAAFSPSLPWVDVAVDGVDVVSTYFTGEVEIIKPNLKGDFDSVEVDSGFRTGFAKWSGTSFAAGRFSGLVADRAERAGLDVWTARDQLIAEQRNAGTDPDGGRDE